MTLTSGFRLERVKGCEILHPQPSEVKDLTRDTHSSLLPLRTDGWIMTGRAAIKNGRQTLKHRSQIQNACLSQLHVQLVPPQTHSYCTSVCLTYLWVQIRFDAWTGEKASLLSWHQLPLQDKRQGMWLILWYLEIKEWTTDWNAQRREHWRDEKRQYVAMWQGD